MAKTKYSKKIKNNKEYYFFRLHSDKLHSPKDIYANTVKELDEKIKKIKYELDNNLITNNTLFLTFFENWLFEIHFLNKKISTKERYEITYRNYININYFKKLKLKDLNLEFIQNYYNQLNNKGASSSIIKSIHKLLAPAIRYAFAQNRIIKDFSKSLVVPQENKIKNKTVEPFSLNEQIEFIKAIKGHKQEVLFLTALNTGLRQGELFALTWDDIDFSNNLIRVNKNVKDVTHVSRSGRGKYEQIIQTPKTAKSNRFVPIPHFLIPKLLDHKEKQLQYINLAANLYTDKNLVFPNSVGNFFNTSNIRKILKTILNSKEIKQIKFHDLRHTYATRLLEAGEEPKIIQELLGHSNISVTLDTYTHVLEKLKIKSTSKLDDLFANIDF